MALGRLGLRNAGPGQAEASRGSCERGRGQKGAVSVGSK